MLVKVFIFVFVDEDDPRKVVLLVAILTDDIVCLFTLKGLDKE